MTATPSLQPTYPGIAGPLDVAESSHQTVGSIIESHPSALSSLVYSSAASGASVALWVYDKVITNPLRVLYFVGPIWKNAPPDEICHSITSVPAAWWAATPERQRACLDLLERRFASFDAGFATCVYFAFLTFVVLQITCTCLCVRPLARALRSTQAQDPR